MTQGPNKFIWYDLMTTDQDAAEAFYRAVPGGSWIVQAMDPKDAAFAVVSTTR